MKKVNQLKAGVILSYLSMGLGTLISIIYTPVMLRLLGQSEYGLYQLVYSVVSYLGLLSFGFTASYMRFYARYKAQEEKGEIARLNGMFMTVYLVVAVIAIFCGMFLQINVETIFHNSLSPSEIGTAKVLMVLMVFNVAITFPASVFDSIVTAHEQYVFQRTVNLLRQVFNPLLCLPLLLMGYKSIGMVAITTVLTILSLIINAIFCFKKLHIRFVFKEFRWGLLKEIAIFSSFIFMNQIIDQINWSVDKFILGMISGTIGVSVYSIGAQLNTYYLHFSTSISTVFIPRVNRIVATTNDDEALTRLFIKVGRIQFIFIMAIMTGFIFLGQPFINLWAGDGYTDSYPVALWLMIPVTIPLTQNLGIEIQRAKNMHKFRSIVYLLIAIGNVGLSIPLCYQFGPVGCAIGTAISLTIGNGFIMNWYYHARIGLNIREFWWNIVKFVPALVPPVIFGIVMMKFVTINSYLTLLPWILLYAVVYVISMYALGMNVEERALLRGPVEKIFRRRK